MIYIVASQEVTMYSQKVIDRFWSKVDKSGGPDACWPWTAGTYRGGYGQFAVDRTGRRAHAVALEIESGETADGRLAMHTVCDNPPCCNPSHLKWGTTQENTTERQTKGRHVGPRGTKAGQAKLTPEIVLECRRRYMPGCYKNGSRALAREFNVNQSTLHMAITGKQWKYICDQSIL